MPVNKHLAKFKYKSESGIDVEACASFLKQDEAIRYLEGQQKEHAGEAWLNGRKVEINKEKISANYSRSQSNTALDGF